MIRLPCGKRIPQIVLIRDWGALEAASLTVRTTPHHDQVTAAQEEHHSFNHRYRPLPGGIHHDRRSRDGGPDQPEQPPGQAASHLSGRRPHRRVVMSDCLRLPKAWPRDTIRRYWLRCCLYGPVHKLSVHGFLPLFALNDLRRVML